MSLFPWQHCNVAMRAVQLLFKEELQHEKEAECDEPEAGRKRELGQEESTGTEGGGRRMTP